MLRTWALAVALAVPSNGWAQSAERDIVVTASRIGDVSGVAVTDRATIEQRQPRSLLEVLDDLPGVRAVSTGGPAGGSFVSIRGGEPNFTTVLLDGVRLNDLTNAEGGAFDFALLDPLAVERIEVLRTAASAVHGSDALSGVVQIVTRLPTAKGIDVAAQGWVDSRYGGSAAAGVSGGWDSGGLRVSGGHYDSGTGDPAGSLRRSQGLARARQTLGKVRLDALGLYAEHRGTGFPQDSGGPLLAVNRNLEARDGMLVLAAGWLSVDPGARLRPTLSFSRSLQRSNSAAPAIFPGTLGGVPATTAHNRFERIEASAALAGDLGPVTASAGGVLLREDGRSDGTLEFGFPLPTRFARTRTTHSGFAEASARLSAGVTLSGALRYDAVAGRNSWTGRGGLVWQTAAKLRLIARAATGYKLPSLYALGHPLIGNASLAPERSRTLEAGIEWLLPSGHLAITAFDNRYRDLIDFDPVHFKLVNRDQVGARGIDGDIALRLGRYWSIGGTASYVALDSATPLRGRPAWHGNVRVTWEHGRWQATAALRANSAFDDSAIPTGARVTAGHAEADAGLRYAATDHLAVRLTLHNIGDNRSWDAVGTPQPGRSVRMAISLD